ncbi:MAG: nucleotidyltransferase family protein [Spirosomaceae bacterium]|nr:nucleotidyltransferase family protein [Spirosomataceae bacterium]
MNVAIIILAAGKSSRMGVPKQALEINGKSLIKTVIDTALETKCYPITVVVGANKSAFVSELEPMPVTLIDNPNWEKGMGTSIKMGLVGAFMVEKNFEAVIVLTVDMPFVTTSLINELIEKAADESVKIVACRYGESGGIPALFKRDILTDILELDDAEGAKSVILKHKTETAWVDFPNGNIDLDTPTDLRKYLASQTNSN